MCIPAAVPPPQGLLGRRVDVYMHVCGCLWEHTHATHFCIDFYKHVEKDEFTPMSLTPVHDYRLSLSPFPYLCSLL